MSLERLHIYAECQRYVLCYAAGQAGGFESGADDGVARSDPAWSAGGGERAGLCCGSGECVLSELDGIERGRQVCLAAGDDGLRDPLCDGWQCREWGNGSRKVARRDGW